MKRFWVEIQVGLLVIVGAALVLAMGYLAYTSMSSILSSVTRESKPDIKLNLVQMLATDLDKAENSVRLYAYSRNDDDLRPYRQLLAGIDEQMAELIEAGKDNPVFIANIDTIGGLIAQKILLWNEMLPLYTVKETEKYLDTISKELENKIVADSIRENRTFFQKIFKRQAKVELDEQRIVKDIVEVKSKDSEQQERIRNKEMALAEANSRLTRQFYDLVKRIEEAEYKARKLKAAEADTMAEETYRWIGWFSISATMAMLLVIFVITRYIRKSHAYQMALIKARKEAETLARTKEIFVANVTHELRTPMNVISGFVDQLLKRPQDDENSDTLKIIKASSDHLVRIVNDILDFSKLESGKMKLEPVHFKTRDVFNEMLLLFRNSIRDKDISMEVEIGDEVPEYLFGDSIRLKQILINLAGNAIKFTEKGSVTIGVRAENQVAGHLDLKLTVSDTGIGIAQDKLNMIFDDFTQAESGTTQKFGGTGLGLSIVRKLVELHNGEIKVHSTMGEGTTFTCRLPYRKGKKEEIAMAGLHSYSIPEALKSMRILVVDDEVYNRKLVAAILKKWDISFREADTGEKAVAEAGQQQFDLILMDNRMPGMDGLQASKKIRAMMKKKKKDTPIVSFTAATITKELKKEYGKAGISMFLPKPFTESELLKLLLKLKNLRYEDVARVEADLTSKPQAEQEVSSAIDLEQLYRVAGGDEQFVEEMLMKFIESFDAGYEVMMEGIEQEDLKRAGDAAHKLASPCRHIGAEDLLALLKEIEAEAEEENPEVDLKEKAGQAGREYQNVRKMILQHLDGRKKITT